MQFRRNASLLALALALALPLLLVKPAYADVVWFDIDHDLLYVPAVTMGAATYPNVILQHLGELRFALQAAGAPVSDADETSSSFDSASGILRIATALVGCTTYVDVALQIGGDFSFALLAATEKMPGTVGLALTVQSANANVKAGESARFTVGAIGPGPFSYQWFVDGVTVAGATDSAFSTAPLTVEDTGRVVTVRVSNGGGSLISAPATVAVASGNVVPDITADPVSFTSASLADGTTATRLTPVKVQGLTP